MPSDDLRSDPPKGSLPGFATFADDTPRRLRASEPRSWASPEAAAAGPDPEASWEDTELTAPRRRVWPVAGAGAAVALAFGGGLLIARHDPAPSAVRVEADAPPMNVEVAALKPAPIPSVATVGKLDVLPRDSEPRRAPAPAAAQAQMIPAPVAPSPAPAPSPSPLPSPMPREPAIVAPARDASATVAPPQRSRSFACGDALTPARRMVCADMDLAALDRRMKRAYAAALAAGASPAALAADQEDWMAVREEAAEHSRYAVASIYRQRIDELWDVADQAPR